MLTAVSLLASAGSAQVTLQWAAPVSGEWYAVGNWSPAGIPDTYSEIAVLGFSSPYTVTASSTSLYGLRIENPSATLVIPEGTAVFETTVSIDVGGIVNHGIIRVVGGGTSQSSVLYFDRSASISGTGVIRLEHPSKSKIAALDPGITITQTLGHTLAGTGILPSGDTQFINDGLVSADVLGKALSVQGVNRSVLEAINGGVLSANVEQVGAGVVRIDGPLSRLGGTVRGGAIEFTNGGGMNTSISLYGVTFGTGVVLDGGQQVLIEAPGLTLGGGDMRVRNALVRLLPRAALDGPGEIRCEHAKARVWASGDEGSFRSINQSGHRIAGFGTVAGVGGKLTNDGVIEADVAGGTLEVYEIDNRSQMNAVGGGILSFSLGSTAQSRNSGLISVQEGSTLRIGAYIIQSPTGIIRSDGGAIDMAGDFSKGAIVEGGEIDATNGGIWVDKTRGIALRNTHIRGDWLVNGYVDVQKSVVLDGTMRLLPGSNASVTLGSNAFIGGSGTIRLEDPAKLIRLPLNVNLVAGQGAGHTIEGIGQIDWSTGLGTFINHGTIAPGLPVGRMSMNKVLVSPTGVIEIELAGDDAAERDSILNTGTLTLDGTLRVRFRDGYVLPACGEHVAISGGAIAGAFAEIDAPEMPVGAIGVRYEAGAVTIVYYAADYDGSAYVDLDDYIGFVTDFMAGDEGADVDHSGVVDTDDFDAFVGAFEEGC